MPGDRHAVFTYRKKILYRTQKDVHNAPMAYDIFNGFNGTHIGRFDRATAVSHAPDGGIIIGTDDGQPYEVRATGKLGKITSVKEASRSLKRLNIRRREHGLASLDDVKRKAVGAVLAPSVTRNERIEPSLAAVYGLEVKS